MKQPSEMKMKQSLARARGLSTAPEHKIVVAHDAGYKNGYEDGYKAALSEKGEDLPKNGAVAKGQPVIAPVDACVLVSDPGYQSLVSVFHMAHEHAARTKGKERHANDLPFEQQRMLSLARTLKDPAGSLAYQVLKKVTEGLQMNEYERTKAELLGAINYLAGMVLLLGERPVPPQTDASWEIDTEAFGVATRGN